MNKLPTFRVTSLCGCAWEARFGPDALRDTTVKVDLVCPTHGKLGVRLALTSPVNADLLRVCKRALLCITARDEHIYPHDAVPELEEVIAEAEGPPHLFLKAENGSYIGGPKPHGDIARGKSAEDVWIYDPGDGTEA